jgi:uncharacterized protein (DUF2252 family)
VRVRAAGEEQKESVSDDEQRTSRILEVLSDAFSGLAEADPAAFRRRFRKMAAEPFAFYRGTACLFYADVGERDDPWADERTSRVWIQGDLHAENFGTYMNGRGVLVFDVNDFDEAYLGHFTWDLQRLAASVALLGWNKALPDDAITDLVTRLLRAYLDQVEHFVGSDRDDEWALRLGNATGAVQAALLDAQLSTRIDLLDRVTEVRDYARRFRDSPTVRRLDDEERDVVERAYASYLDTLPDGKRRGSLSYDLKDVVGKTGIGIGSSGLPVYSLLVEGNTQALENDVVLTMKQGIIASPSRVRPDERAREAFEHEGHRTAVSRHALQAHADPWVGWTRMDGGPHDGIGFVVQEFSPYGADLEWDSLTEPEEIGEVLEQLGRATAKVHCVSDADDDSAPLVEFQTEEAVSERLSGSEDEFVSDLVAFAHDYAAQVRRDHALFVDAFRAGRALGVGPS